MQKMKPRDLYQGSTGEKRSRDLFVFVRVAVVFAMLMVLCAGLSECRAETFQFGTGCHQEGDLMVCPLPQYLIQGQPLPNIQAQIKALEKRIEALEKRNADADEAQKKAREEYMKGCTKQGWYWLCDNMTNGVTQ